MQDAHTAELLLRLQEAQEAVRARDDFLAVAAHELRSPMHALALRLAALERIAARDGTPLLQEELRRTRRTVDRYVQRAMTLLDLSRIHTGTLHPQRTWVSASELVRHVVEGYREEAQFRGATLQADADPLLAGCWDPHMLEQILSNLVSNAIRYGNGSPVQVSASLDTPELACFEVADRGPGIAEANRRRIFEKFERLASGARERGGFGLGLWIVASMVEAHRGTIEVAARDGGGTVFRVRLPVQAPADATQETRT